MHAIYTLMNFVAFIAFVLLIIGLIRPAIVVRWGTKQTRGRALLYYGLSFMVLAIVAAQVKPQELIEKERQERIQQAQQREERAREKEKEKERERQEQLQKAQPILEKAKQQLSAARSAYASGDFKNAIASAQEATSTLKSIQHIPEASTLDDEAKTLLADAEEELANAPDYILSADQLYQEYENNEVAADNKYKGKIVLISGTIQDIGKDFMSAYIRIGSDLYLGVRCSFSEEASVARLSKGQRVRVKGEVSGKGVNVLVKNCSLQEKGRQEQLQKAQPILEKAKQQLSTARSTSSAEEELANAPSYTLSANALFREYDNNEVAADTKYKGKIVLISGTVQDISKDILGKPFIVIGGSGFLDGVQCSFTKNEEPALARLSKGQRVRVMGEVSGKLGNVQVEDCSLQ